MYMFSRNEVMPGLFKFQTSLALCTKHFVEKTKALWAVHTVLCRPRVKLLIEETQRRQYEGHNTPLGCHTDQGL